ncbi:myosin heavy chain, striated muscle-like [Branchiostoma floridae x Branchiostoma belcheri]
MPAYGPSLMDQPSEWFLAGKPDVMRAMKTAPYDPKKNFWAPDKKEIFIKVEAKSEKGDDVTCVGEGGAVSSNFNHLNRMFGHCH